MPTISAAVREQDFPDNDLGAIFASLFAPEWEHWAFGGEADPHGLAFVHHWEPRAGSTRCADVVILDGEPRSITWRAVLVAEDDSPMVPEFVTWFSIGGLNGPVEELLRLPAPGMADAPECRVVASETLRVPAVWWNSGAQLIRAGRRRVARRPRRGRPRERSPPILMADASAVFHPRILEIKLPKVMDKLGKQLNRLRISGWTMYYFGRGGQALGLGAVNRGDAYADVI
ncbi:hypothetical protein ATK36_0678 [Amycolatopsis sulphurea]|uniref:Uncharacterized protein n=1 Tax=Amycolatopsis sulphurea TaxID=76022 RepID=A0A2A9G391_9PSEU|nr:hypothetical protein ATK36_0678 [Amycolatopsis sulphurea]